MAPVHRAIHPAVFRAITTGLHQDLPEPLLNVPLQATMTVLPRNGLPQEPMPEVTMVLTGNWLNEEIIQVHSLLLLPGREQFVHKHSSNLLYVLRKEEHPIQSAKDRSPFAEMLNRHHVLPPRKEYKDLLPAALPTGARVPAAADHPVTVSQEQEEDNLL